MPAPLPAKLLLLHGRGNGKDSAGKLVPTPPAFERVAPEPPEWLDDEGRESGSASSTISNHSTC